MARGYITIPATLPPLGWLPDTIGDPSGYPLDVSSDQRYTRPWKLFGRFPWPQFETVGVAAVSPLAGTFQYLALAGVSRLPAGPYQGGDGINVVGGQSFGYSDFNGLEKLRG